MQAQCLKQAFVGVFDHRPTKSIPFADARRAENTVGRHSQSPTFIRLTPKPMQAQRLDQTFVGVFDRRPTGWILFADA